MKNLILILFIALVSCSGSDDNSLPPVNIDENLVGKWSLIQYSEWPAGNFYYENNEIIWEFHQNGDLRVTVEEQTWVYPYMYLQTSTNTDFSTGVQELTHFDYQYMLISGIPDTLGYSITENGTTLSIAHQPAADGHVYRYDFNKIE